MNPSISYARTQRSFAGAAPKLSDDYYKPAESKETIFRNSRPAQWKPSSYTKQLFYACFKNW